jgi:hypothetical protein
MGHNCSTAEPAPEEQGAMPVPARASIVNDTRWRRPQVTVGDDETEDVAVRKFMKSVVQSNLINQVRRRARPAPGRPR